MAKRTICIQRSAKLSIKDSLLVIEQEERRAAISLEDIWVLILETHQAQITTAALSKLVDSGIGVMLCGDDHMPNGLLLPIGAHSRHAEIVDDQLALSKPMKKRLWQRIVRAKIQNQAAVLKLLNIEDDKLTQYAKETFSGDTTNRESVAAAHYFKCLLPDGGRRSSSKSDLFDYGYTVLRAGVGRTAVAGGWLVSRGIHHDNNLNAFNLVDDLIEPFRPVVDLMILQGDLHGGLTPQNKAVLASVFEYCVQTPRGKTTVQSAIERELESLRSAVLAANPNLLELPTVIPLQKAVYE